MALGTLVDTVPLWATHVHMVVAALGTATLPWAASLWPQLKNGPVFPTSSQDGGRFHCFDSRGIPTLRSWLKKRPVAPIETREEPLGLPQDKKDTDLPLNSR